MMKIRDGRSAPAVAAFIIFMTAMVLALLASDGSVRASQAFGGTRGIELTVRTPETERFEVATDEIELQRRSGRAPQQEAKAASGTARATLQRTTPGGTIFATRGAATLQDVGTLARDLEAQNPGAVAHLVLYEAGRPRSEATRRLLGRDVVVLFGEGTDPDAALKGLSAMSVRPLASAPRAYVVEAVDALSALALADQLRGMPGVQTAYPLLQRRQFPR